MRSNKMILFGDKPRCGKSLWSSDKMNEWMQEFEEDWDKDIEDILDSPRLKEVMGAICECFEELIERESKRLMEEYNLSYSEAMCVVLSKIKDAWSD